MGRPSVSACLLRAELDHGGLCRICHRLPHAICGFLDAARKHGISVLTAIRDALAGNPWMPPIPDPP